MPFLKKPYEENFVEFHCSLVLNHNLWSVDEFAVAVWWLSGCLNRDIPIEILLKNLFLLSCIGLEKLHIFSNALNISDISWLNHSYSRTVERYFGNWKVWIYFSSHWASSFMYLPPCKRQGACFREFFSTEKSCRSVEMDCNMKGV